VCDGQSDEKRKDRLLGLTCRTSVEKTHTHTHTIRVPSFEVYFNGL